MAKQYLLLLEDQDIVAFKKVMPSVLFLEVQGMEVAGNPMFKILATPLSTPVGVVAPSTDILEPAVNE